jgi:hypothetical protein
VATLPFPAEVHDNQGFATRGGDISTGGGIGDERLTPSGVIPLLKQASFKPSLICDRKSASAKVARRRARLFGLKGSFRKPTEKWTVTWPTKLDSGGATTDTTDALDAFDSFDAFDALDAERGATEETVEAALVVEAAGVSFDVDGALVVDDSFNRRPPDTRTSTLCTVMLVAGTNKT